MTRLFAVLTIIILLLPASGDEPPRNDKPTSEIEKLNAEALALHRQGRSQEAAAKLRQVLEISKKTYPSADFPDGHEQLATAHTNLGRVLRAGGSLREAAGHFELALAMNRKLFPSAKFPRGHENLADSLDGMGTLLLSRGEYAKAAEHLQEALEMRRRLFPANAHPDGNADVARSLANLGYARQKMGMPDAAVPLYREALAILRRLHPETKEPNGNYEIARALNNLGQSLHAQNNLDEALQCHEQALAMFRKLFSQSQFPDGHPDLATGLAHLGHLRFAMGAYEESLAYFEQVYKMFRALIPVARFPNGHPELATSLMNLAGSQRMLGAQQRSAALLDEALAMSRALFPKERFPNGHPQIAECLFARGNLRDEMGDISGALADLEESVTMHARLYPPSQFPSGHPTLAHGLNFLGVVFIRMGAYEKSLAALEQALAMRRQLYPPARYPAGHVELSTCLSNMATLFHEMRQVERSVAFANEAVAMDRQLYPADRFPLGHPDFATHLSNLGRSLKSNLELGRAMAVLQEAKTMWLALYPADRFPNGHTRLVSSLANLAAAQLAAGRHAQATASCEEALRLARKLFPATLFPDGHPVLVQCMLGLGHCFHAAGNLERAEAQLGEALRMRTRLTNRQLLSSSESDALAFVRSQEVAGHAYLSVTAERSNSERQYEAVWKTKSMVARLIRNRQEGLRSLGGEKKTQLERLQSVRFRVEQLLLEAKLKPAERDKLLTKLVDERDRLERDLAGELAVEDNRGKTNEHTPESLARVLPKTAAYIDFVRYVRYEFDRSNAERSVETATPSYAAFLVVAGRPVVRVELGPQERIDAMIAQWRRGIEIRDGSASGSELRRAVWQPIAKLLPHETRTVYIAPDGDLSRLPWSALPGAAEGTVLLEEYAIAQVPHGAFLLEQLTGKEASTNDESTLLVGALEYGKSPWPALAGSEAEVKAIARCAPTTAVQLTHGDASHSRVRLELARARYVHLATHGFFNDGELRLEKLRAQNAIRDWSAAAAAGDRPEAAQNPLGFVGVVLSGGQRMTGLSLLDLRLEKVSLATLSACETGLGELIGGEGVFGLARAFHLAGCRNVVASLWKVSDAATAALMAKFYHELWVNKKAPLAALREAQLTIYHNPELIPDLAGERGAPKAKEALAAKTSTANTANRKKLDTKLWAAFVLSGAGRE